MVTIHIRIETEAEQDSMELPITISKKVGTMQKEVDMEELKQELQKSKNSNKREISIVHPKTGSIIKIRDKECQQIIDHVHSEEDLEIYLDSLENAKQKRIDELSKEIK